MTLWSRLRAVTRRWRRSAWWERSLDDELHAYLDQEIETRIASGLSPAEARRAALAAFGGVEQVKERVRAGATGAWVDTLRHDIRSARRALWHSRGYAGWVIGSLAIGMSVTVAALALLNAMLLLPFPEVTEQNRLVRVSLSRTCGRPDCWVRMASPEDYDAAREGLTGLQGLAAYGFGDVAVVLPQARSMRGAFTSVNYFDILGVRPAIGRVFDRGDADARAPVAVIAHSAWLREFDGQTSAIGRSIRVGDHVVQVVGVAPPMFMGIDRNRPGGMRSMSFGARGPDVWLPIWMMDSLVPLTTAEHRRQERDLSFVGRLRDGTDASSLHAEAGVLAVRLAAVRGLGSEAARAEVLRVWKVNPRSWHFAVIIVMPIPILVLVIACVNAANLMLARGSQRQREIAIRLAIGAGRGRLVRQLLAESAMLALLATAVAVPIASWGLQFVGHQIGFQIPVDPTVLGLSVLTAVVTTVTFGLLPAMRVSAQAPSSALGPVAARHDAGPRQSRMRRALVAAQVSLSLALLATGSQLIGTVRAQAVSAGTPPHRLLIARFDLQPLKLPTADAETFYRDLVAGSLRLPGVEAAGLARHAAVWTFGQGAGAASLLVWRPADRPEDGSTVAGGYAAVDLFAAVGLRVVAGRGFTEADRQARPQVAVINETAARGLQGPAVGHTLRIAPRGGDLASSIEVRIVGVIEAAHEPRLEQGEPPAPKMYLPSPLEPEPALSLYLRTHGPAAALAPPLRELVGRIASRVPIQEIGSLEEFNERSYASQLWLARASAVLGVIGLLLATAGLYGISSYVVALRSREMAIRMAIGARPRAILTMVLRQSMRLALAGLVVGGGTALAVSRVIQSEYHGIERIDGAALAGAVALFLAAMFVASVIPAIRAARLDPVESLRDG